MGKKVFITSVPRKTVTGLSEFVDPTSQKRMNKTKMGKCTTRLQALYDARIGGLANYISYTPWIDPATGLQQKDKDGNLLTLQDKLEQKYNKPKGFYTNMPHRLNQRSEDATYFQSETWILNDGTTVFDLDIEKDELGYYVMLASSKVANSEREWLDHKWPRAEFYISLENEGDELKFEKNKVRTMAFAALVDPLMTPDYKRKFVSLLNLGSTRASLTQLQVDNILYEFIDKSSYTVGSNIDRFNKIFELIKTPHGREVFEARYILAQAIDNRVIFEKQDTYTWSRSKGNIVIGERYEDAIDYILNPKKEAEVEEILGEIKKKLIG